MPRTLDEIIAEEQSAYAQTPIPPIATYSTPGWEPAMGALNTPSQAELIRQATPTLAPPMMSLSQMNAQNMARAMGATPMGYPVAPPPPPPSPMTAMMAAHAVQYVNPQAAADGGGLSATQGFLDPNNAGHALAQQSLSGPSMLGAGLSYAGTAMSIIPGAQLVGTGLSLGGQWLGDQLTNNAATRWVHRQMYGSAAQDLSNMAQLQHGTAGLMNLTGSSAGLGGTGMSAPGALQLGQRYRRMAQNWAGQNPELAEQMGGGDADVGAQRYQKDLSNLTRMAGEHGLLDAATNIDQVGDTVQKLFKVLGTMGKITGDPDFKNNLREIANMRQLGFTIDQAVNATQDLQRYARGAGMTREQMMAGGGAMGQGVFANAGMVGGVGMVYGAQATMQARQLAGAYTPMQEALLGGREGIAQRWTAQQAQFASGPMNMMMGAAMSAGPGGTLNLDSGRLATMLGGGTTLSGLAGQSQGNMMRIARQMAQQQGRSVQDVMVELMQRQPELQPQIAQQLGPEGMRMLQMQTISSLARPGDQGGMGMGLHTAAQLVAGGDPKQAQMLVGMMSSPEFYQREQDRLRRHLGELRGEAKQERLRGRESREELRAIGESVSGTYARANAKKAEEAAREIQEREDESRGIRRAYISRTMQTDQRLVDEATEQAKEEARIDMTTGSGVGRFERARRIQEGVFKKGALSGLSAVTDEQIAIAERARGNVGIWGGGVGTFMRARAADVFHVKSAIADFYGQKADTAPFDRFKEGVRETMNRTLEMAQAIEDTRDWSVSDLADISNQGTKALSEAGLDTGMMSHLEKVMTSHAERVGRGEEGTVLDAKALRKHLRAALVEKNVPTAAINKMLSDKNMDYWKKYQTTLVSQFGSKDAKAALEETTDTATQFAGDTVEKVRAELDTFQEKYEEQLQAAGITEDRWFTDSLHDEEKLAMEALESAGSPAQREAMVLLGIMEGGEDEGITEEMRAEADAQFLALRNKAPKEVEAAKKQFEKLASKGGDIATKTLGKVAKVAQKYTGTITSIGKLMEEGAKTGKGYFGFIGKKAQLQGRVRALGGEIVDGAITMPGVGGAGTSQDAAIKVAESQIANLDEMKKQFAGFGRSSKTLQIAAEAQIKAATLMGGRQVAEVVKQMQEELKEN